LNHIMVVTTSDCWYRLSWEAIAGSSVKMKIGNDNGST